MTEQQSGAFDDWRREQRALRKSRLALGAEQRKLEDRLRRVQREDVRAIALEEAEQGPDARIPIALSFQPPIRFTDGPPQREPIYSGSTYTDFGFATPFTSYTGYAPGGLGFGASRIPFAVQPTLFLRPPTAGIQINVSADGGRPTFTTIPAPPGPPSVPPMLRPPGSE